MNAARPTTTAPPNQAVARPIARPRVRWCCQAVVAQADQDGHSGGNEQLGLGQECQTDGHAAQEGVAARGRAVDPPGEEEAHQPEEQAMCRRVAIGTDVIETGRSDVTGAREHEDEHQAGQGRRERTGHAAEQQVEDYGDEAGDHQVAHHQGPKAHTEEIEQERVEIGGQGAVVIDQVRIESLPLRQLPGEIDLSTEVDLDFDQSAPAPRCHSG